MTGLDGIYAIVAQTPLGDQRMTTTIKTSGETFAGQSDGAMGLADIHGVVSGQTLIWRQVITRPIPLTLRCQATIVGDTLSGSINTGLLGIFPLTGKRVG